MYWQVFKLWETAGIGFEQLIGPEGIGGGGGIGAVVIVVIVVLYGATACGAKQVAGEKIVVPLSVGDQDGGWGEKRSLGVATKNNVLGTHGRGNKHRHQY